MIIGLLEIISIILITFSQHIGLIIHLVLSLPVSLTLFSLIRIRQVAAFVTSIPCAHLQEREIEAERDKERDREKDSEEGEKKGEGEGQV